MNTNDIAERAEDMKEQAQDWAEDAAARAREAAGMAGEYLRDNIWTSVAIAAGVGAIVGFLLAKTRD